MKWAYYLSSVNLILGLFLWFLFSTDYSLTGATPDILFPPGVGIVAQVSLNGALIALIADKTSSKRQRLLVIFAHLPSIIGGGLYVLIGLLMLVPPFTLGTFFLASEIADETEIQRAVSPDGTRTAYVYFRGVGAYGSGNGRIFVRVRHQILPFLERDIFYLPRSYADENSSNYLEWRDNNTLYISETKQEVRVGIIEAEIPPVIAIPYRMFRFLLHMVNRRGQ